MYLIHAQLVSESGDLVPADTAELVMRYARPADLLEHVELHPDAAPGPVLGLFLLSASLGEAESAAATLCSRALEGCRELWGFRLLSCRAVLPAAYYERLLTKTDGMKEDDT